MLRRIRVLLAAVFLAAAGPAGGRLLSAQQGGGAADTMPPAAQTPPGGQPTPTFRAGINFVRVDVILTDRNGNQIADLKPGDFEVLEDGQPQAIETFRFVSLDGGLSQAAITPPREIRTDADEELEASKDDVRLFGIFLDDYHVNRDSSNATRNQIARFVETQLGPSDMVGVMYPLESVASVRMTRNHDAVQRAIRQFNGRKYDYQPRNEYEERYAHYPAETVEQIRNQVSLSAIRGLITHMGTLKEGRKALILVSEGYTNTLPPQLRDPVANRPGVNNPDRYNPQAGNNPDELRTTALSNASIDLDLREVYAAANRNNTAIYAVDPRGLAAFEFGMDKPIIGIQTDGAYLNSTMQTLRTLADNTDGKAIVNRNDITLAMKQIVRDTSAYYLLGYTSTQAPSDGKFHQIKVRVKRPGVQVRARNGYWALNREETREALAPPKPAAPSPVAAALTSATATPRDRFIRTWIGTERGESGRTRVTFAWEPAPRRPGEALRPEEAPVRVALTAAGADGAPYFRGRVPEETGKAAGGTSGAPSAPAGAGARVSFEVAPGMMQIRLAVQGEGGNTIDSEMRELVVPDLTGPGTALATPEVFRVRTARELAVLKADAHPAPTAAREFSRSERVLIRVRAYGAGATAPRVTARLLNRAGQAMSELPVSVSGAAASPEIEVPLASLAPGEYVLEIGAAGDGGEAKELLGFRVTA